MSTAFAKTDSDLGFEAPAREKVSSPVDRRATQRRWALLACGLCCAAAIGYEYYRWIQPEVVATDDAYVVATLAQVTPQIDGIISEVKVHDTQYVHRGQTVVILDRQDAELDYQAAAAAYEEALRRAREEISKLKAAEENVGVKAALVQQAELQLHRRSGTTGVVSGEEVSDAQTTLTNARYALGIAEHQAAAQRAIVSELDPAAAPSVKEARISLARAELKLRRTELRAPADGLIAQLRAQAGQQIPAGATLMSVVPIHDLYVEANFKESQLDHIKVGQRALLTSDLYGRHRIFHGYVAGIGGGTGAVFSILPAQNATGNWIKVVQRLPVRILLDPAELKETPLRVGLSMNVTVQIDQGGRSADLARSSPALRTIARTSY